MAQFVAFQLNNQIRDWREEGFAVCRGSQMRATSETAPNWNFSRRSSIFNMTAIFQGGIHGR